MANSADPDKLKLLKSRKAKQFKSNKVSDSDSISITSREAYNATDSEIGTLGSSQWHHDGKSIQASVDDRQEQDLKKVQLRYKTNNIDNAEVCSLQNDLPDDQKCFIIHYCEQHCLGKSIQTSPKQTKGQDARNKTRHTKLLENGPGIRDNSKACLLQTDFLDDHKCSIIQYSAQQYEDKSIRGSLDPAQDQNIKITRARIEKLLKYKTDTRDSSTFCLLENNYPNDQKYNIIQYFINCRHGKEALQLSHIDKLLNAYDLDINEGDAFGQTVLMEAVCNWHLDVVKYIVEVIELKGCKLDTRDCYGRSVFHVAAASNREDVIHFILDKYPCKIGLVNQRIHSKWDCSSKETPLHIAARRGTYKALKALLDVEGVDIEAEDYLGRTPLFVAAEYGYEDEVELLIRKGASVTINDKNGRSLFVQMAMTAPLSMRKALNHLVELHYRKGKVVFDPMKLELADKSWSNSMQTNCLLDMLEMYERGDILTHKVMKQFLSERWKQFAFYGAWMNFAFRLFFLIIWCVWMLSVRWETKHIYKWPTDFWKVLLPMLGLLALLWLVCVEVFEIVYIVKRGRTMARIQVQRIETDLKRIPHKNWQEEDDKLTFLRKEEISKDCLKSQIFYYVRDLWNLFDLIVYPFIIITVMIHVLDVVKNSTHAARVHAQLGVISIILLGVQLMKETAAFPKLGELITMLGAMAMDIARFIFLYAQFFLPFCFAFWVIYGGQRYPHGVRTCTFNCTGNKLLENVITKTVDGWAQEFDSCETNCELLTVDGMSTFNDLCFSLFRLSLVDDYDLKTMTEIDPIFSYILVGAFLATSSILALNFLIGLMSNALSGDAHKYVEETSSLKRLRAINFLEQSFISKYFKRKKKTSDKIVIKGAVFSDFWPSLEDATEEVKSKVTNLDNRLKEIERKIDSLSHSEREL